MKVILPGSYDPITLGHLAVIKYASERYSEVFAVAFINPDKKYTFSPKERVEMIALATAELSNVKVDFSEGRVIDYMRENRIDKIVKGYRNEGDLEYEKIQAEYNLAEGGYETELYRSEDALSDISSTLAREGLSSGAELDGILPEAVIGYARAALSEKEEKNSK